MEKRKKKLSNIALLIILCCYFCIIISIKRPPCYFPPETPVCCHNHAIWFYCAHNFLRMIVTYDKSPVQDHHLVGCQFSCFDAFYFNYLMTLSIWTMFWVIVSLCDHFSAFLPNHLFLCFSWLPVSISVICPAWFSYTSTWFLSSLFYVSCLFNATLLALLPWLLSAFFVFTLCLFFHLFCGHIFFLYLVLSY